MTDTDLKTFFYKMSSDRNGRPLGSYQYYLELPPVQLLANKKLCLVGGGRSPIPSELFGRGARPKSVTNIDPHIKMTDDYAPNNPFGAQFLPENFLETKIEPDSFDEIWALFSLPMYCENTAEIQSFYKKCILSLAPAGNLRVFPSRSLLSPIYGWKKCNRIFEDFENHCGKIQCRDHGVLSSAIFSAPENKDEINECMEKLK